MELRGRAYSAYRRSSGTQSFLFSGEEKRKNTSLLRNTTLISTTVKLLTVRYIKNYLQNGANKDELSFPVFTLASFIMKSKDHKGVFA